MRWMWLCVLLGVLLTRTLSWAVLPDAAYPVLAQDILQTHQAEFAEDVAAGRDREIAETYNLQAAPDYWVWKTDLRKYDVYSQVSPTGSSWDWAQFEALTVAQQQTWFEMFTGQSTVTNYALPNIRAGITSLFKGSPANTAQKAHIDAMGRRLARRIEQLLAPATGTPPKGTGTPADPAVMTYVGTLTSDDVTRALAPARGQ